MAIPQHDPRIPSLPKWAQQEILNLHSTVNKQQKILAMHEGVATDCGISIVPGGDEKHMVHLLPDTPVRIARPGTPIHWGIYVELNRPMAAQERTGVTIRNNNGTLLVRPVVANVITVEGDAF